MRIKTRRPGRQKQVWNLKCIRSRKELGIIKFNLVEEIKNNWAHESENRICSCDDGTGTDIDIRKNNKGNVSSLIIIY